MFLNFRRYVQKATLTVLKTLLRGDWPNNDIICPTGPAASPLKWGKIQNVRGDGKTFAIDSIFWQRFRALSIPAWCKKTTLRVFIILFRGAKKKKRKPFPSPFSFLHVHLKRKSLPQRAQIRGFSPIEAIFRPPLPILRDVDAWLDQPRTN